MFAGANIQSAMRKVKSDCKLASRSVEFVMYLATKTRTKTESKFEFKSKEANSEKLNANR